MAVTDTIGNADSDGSAVTTQAFELDDTDHSSVYSWVAIVDNGFDVDVDVTVQFTTDDDENFNKFITDTGLSGVTVTSGTRDGFGDAQNEPFSYVRLEIDPAADPTSGNLEVTWQKRQIGGGS